MQTFMLNGWQSTGIYYKVSVLISVSQWLLGYTGTFNNIKASQKYLRILSPLKLLLARKGTYCWLVQWDIISSLLLIKMHVSCSYQQWFGLEFSFKIVKPCDNVTCIQGSGWWMSLYPRNITVFNSLQSYSIPFHWTQKTFTEHVLSAEHCIQTLRACR